MRDVSSPSLSPDDQAIIAEEQELHERVKLAVRDEALATAPDMSGIKSRLLELRDEAISASERDLPALFQQLYTHHSLAARNFEKKLPDMRAPYFAHMRLVEGSKTRDILIGYQTFIVPEANVTIIDWRHAALAKVFFNFREGEEYELELPGRLAQGVLALRRIITFDVGELTGVAGPRFSLVKGQKGDWRRVEGDGLPHLEGGAGKAVNVQQFGTGATSRKLPDVSALLDPEQYEILNREAHGALLILGGAGSGKTTVALHRMALLSYQRPRFYQPRFMKVVVPEQGLVRLTQRLLRGLSLDGVSVETFDQWVTAEGRNILKGLPKRLYDWTAPSVVLAKRHPAMMKVVDRYVERLGQQLAARARYLLGERHPELAAIFDQNRDEPLWQKLMAFEERTKPLLAKADGGDRQKDLIAQFLKEVRTRLLDVEGARGSLYVDPELHGILVAASGGAITPKTAEELARHTRKQFEVPDNGLLDDEELKETRAVDGGELEVDEYAGTMDVEDYAVLLYLMLRLSGRVARKSKSLATYHHLVVDEAQDLAPVELRLLGQALSSDATVTVAGDAVQQSDPTVVFQGWDEAMAQLDIGAVEEARLSTNYRCPRPVAELGHKVLGPLAPPALPVSIKEGKAVTFSTFPSEGLAMVSISEALTQLFEKEHLASVAIICENQENARKLFDGLHNLCDVRLVVDGEFDFTPGVDITDVSQVKGLEFDYVIIPDASVAYYPDTAVARRTLHIAVTRAVHQLWVISVGRPSDLIA